MSQTGEQPAAPAGVGMISITQAAKLLMISDERIRQLVKSGHIPKSARNTYPLVGVVQGYIRFLKDQDRNSTKSAGDNRVRDARAAEIEMRIGEKRRELIPTDDAIAALDSVLAVVISGLDGLAARVTRDIPLRRAIDKEVDADRNRMAAKLRGLAAALRTGGDLSGNPGEADAGSVGEEEPEIPRKRGRPRTSRPKPDAIRDRDRADGSGGKRKSHRPGDGLADGEDRS